jgi:hypothetical protein
MTDFDAETAYRTLGREHYETLSENDRALVKFGMTPITALRAVGLMNGYKDHDPAMSKAFVLGLMDGAKTDGGMVV